MQRLRTGKEGLKRSQCGPAREGRNERDEPRQDGRRQYRHDDS